MLRVFFAFPTRLCLINFSIACICDTAGNFKMRHKHKTKAKTPSNISSELFHGFISTEVLNYAVHLNSSHSAWRVFLLLSPPLKSEFFPPKECNIKIKIKKNGKKCAREFIVFFFDYFVSLFRVSLPEVHARIRNLNTDSQIQTHIHMNIHSCFKKKKKHRRNWLREIVKWRRQRRKSFRLLYQFMVWSQRKLWYVTHIHIWPTNFLTNYHPMKSEILIWIIFTIFITNLTFIFRY